MNTFKIITALIFGAAFLCFGIIFGAMGLEFILSEIEIINKNIYDGICALLLGLLLFVIGDKVLNYMHKKIKERLL